jgi:hypothetical protein
MILLSLIRHYSNPREASEPYSGGQWDSALKAISHSPKGDVSNVGALEPTARPVSTASGLAVLAHC